MIVTWVTLEDVDEKTVSVCYGKHGKSLESCSPAEKTHFVEESTKFYVFRASMPNLVPDTVYGKKRKIF